MAVARKLTRILQQRFPTPDKVQLRDDDDKDGIVAIITSKRFRGIDSMQRQDMIYDLLTAEFSAEEQRHILLIVGVTPEEELANAVDE